MRNSMVSIALSLSGFWVLTSCGAPAPLARGSQPASAPTVPTDAAMLTMLNQYCTTCHTGNNAPHGVVLETLADAQTAAAASIKMLNNGRMPPARAQQPDAPTTAAMVAWFTANQ